MASSKKFGGQPLSGTIGITNRAPTQGNEDRDKSGLLDQARNPHAITDTHTTMPAPSTGTIRQSGGSFEGAEGRGGRSPNKVTDTHTERNAPKAGITGSKNSESPPRNR